MCYYLHKIDNILIRNSWQELQDAAKSLRLDAKKKKKQIHDSLSETKFSRRLSCKDSVSFFAASIVLSNRIST